MLSSHGPPYALAALAAVLSMVVSRMKGLLGSSLKLLQTPFKQIHCCFRLCIPLTGTVSRQSSLTKDRGSLRPSAGRLYLIKGCMMLLL